MRRLSKERRVWRRVRSGGGGMPLLEAAAGSTSVRCSRAGGLFHSTWSCGGLESRTASEMLDHGVLRLEHCVPPPRLVTSGNTETAVNG